MNMTAIEWCEHTWNPVTGCLHGCPYCYARRFAERGLGEYGKHPKAERFTPRFHPERLEQPRNVRKPSRVFVCSMADLFGEWVDEHWIREVRGAAHDAPWHTYIWLTKNPYRLEICNKGNGLTGGLLWNYWRANDWVGTTVTRQIELPRAVRGLQAVRGAGVRFISFEPLLGPITPSWGGDMLDGMCDWIIIGAQTGPGAEPVNIEWIASIKQWADDHSIPVFIKDNCGWWSRYQKFPEVTK